MFKTILIFLMISSNLFASVESGSVIKADKINSSIFQVGSIQQALLTEEQFQALNGSCWVLMKGQSVLGSDFSNLTGINTLPNASGRFLRNAGGNAAPLAQIQEDALQQHTHTAWTTHAATQRDLTNSVQSKILDSSGVSKTGNVSSDAKTAGETRPVNLTVNTFLKINNNCSF